MLATQAVWERRGVYSVRAVLEELQSDGAGSATRSIGSSRSNFSCTTRDDIAASLCAVAMLPDFVGKVLPGVYAWAVAVDAEGGQDKVRQGVCDACVCACVRVCVCVCCVCVCIRTRACVCAAHASWSNLCPPLSPSLLSRLPPSC